MKRILVVVTFGFMTMHASSLDLNEAVISRGKDTVRNEAERLASPIITNVVNANGGKPGRGLAYTNLGAGNNWYRLYNKMVIVGVDASAQSLIGRWPLTRWPYELESKVTALYRIGSEGTNQALLSAFVDQSYEQTVFVDKVNMGCLNHAPLRYGDVESVDGGDAELVLFVGKMQYKHDWIVFSPKYDRIVFSIRYALQDVMEFEPSSYQYTSDDRHKYDDAGIRVYAKAYIGNFDGDTHPDIVVWRKRFESRLKTDKAPGFTLSSELLEHYEQDLTAQATLKAGVTGEYLPQKTDSATIKNWLKTSKLTWQKGFPSTSECAGQKGQLIPEMHDVLLNDPDVLQ